MPNPEDIDLSYAIGLPPEYAIEYFQKKGYKITWDWHEALREAHTKAFTVAKVMRLDILKDIRDAVEKALKTGMTFEEFQAELEPKLRAKGWWGKQEIATEDGIKTVQLGSTRRLETIYRTNLQVAYMAGRYKALMKDVANRPYWQYVAVMDSKTRPAHKALNGKVFRYDDPFWDTHFPPNGFGCRCKVFGLSANDMKEEGLQTETKDSPYRNIQPDYGWDYNPGKDAWQPDLDQYPYDIAKLYVDGGLTGPDFNAFYDGLTKGSFPVAVLSEEYKNSIGATSQVVLLSDESLAKNKANHPELTEEEYSKIPDIISSDADVIIQDGELTLVFIKINDRYYNAVVKATASGETLFLTSFRRVDDVEREVGRLKRKQGTKIIKDDLKTSGGASH
ncbi:MAG: minor capsid protein [Nitrospirae bacterium]|nr:minor capsid protein [Nitrospirota bacterium]